MLAVDDQIARKNKKQNTNWTGRLGVDLGGRARLYLPPDWQSQLLHTNIVPYVGQDS